MWDSLWRRDLPIFPNKSHLNSESELKYIDLLSSVLYIPLNLLIS